MRLQSQVSSCIQISLCLTIMKESRTFCEDYLTHREQKVVIERQSFTWSVIPSGVPQGSLLGPLFFVILSDVPDVVMPENTIVLYADDCKNIQTYKVYIRST